MIDYEILLLLDAELSDERQNEIVTRTRELVERGGGTFEGHDVWGRRKLAYEIGHKPEGAYHLLTFSAEPGTLARAQDHRRCHEAPRGQAAEARHGTKRSAAEHRPRARVR